VRWDVHCRIEFPREENLAGQLWSPMTLFSFVSRQVDQWMPCHRKTEVDRSRSQLNKFKRNVWSACEHVVDEPTSILSSSAFFQLQGAKMQSKHPSSGVCCTHSRKCRNGLKVILLIIEFFAFKLIAVFAPRWSSVARYSSSQGLAAPFHGGVIAPGRTGARGGMGEYRCSPVGVGGP
jgi:hypothetical protein